MTTSPTPEPGGSKVVTAIIGVVSLAGGCYLIYQCIKLFFI